MADRSAGETPGRGLQEEEGADKVGSVNYMGLDESVECAYAPCTNRLRRSAMGGPQWCSKGHRDTAEQSAGRVYEFKASPSMSLDGWHIVKQRIVSGSGPWQIVASVFGERRAEIVRGALSAEANDRAGR